MKKPLDLNICQRRLLVEVVTDCLANEVTVTLAHAERVVAPGESAANACSGIFDEAAMLLAVAAGKPPSLWIPTLLHEYCHLRQFLDGLHTGSAFDVLHTRFWEWLDDEIQLKTEEIDASLHAIVECERDCERRTLRVIKKRPGLGIDPTVYVRKANTYLYFYQFVSKHRRWYTQRPPHEVQEIEDCMPDRIQPLKTYLTEPPHPKFEQMLWDYVF